MLLIKHITDRQQSQIKDLYLHGGEYYIVSRSIDTAYNLYEVIIFPANMVGDIVDWEALWSESDLHLTNDQIMADFVSSLTT